ncbi:MAG TPA: alpha/beta hydrolase [Steroidobacteraceae bacterium]|nr:alpha/beta hydrolase [Steroidobacteraceae bacterium]
MQKGSRILFMRMCLLPLAIFLAAAAHAADFQGQWQGHVHTERLDRPYVFTITKGAHDSWAASVIIDDDWGSHWKAVSLSIVGPTIKFSVPSVGSTYEGQLSEDGNSIEGMWSLGKQLVPLRMARATATTRWREPTPHKIQFVTVDDGLKLEVIDWGGKGRPIVMLPALGLTAHVFSQLAAKLTPHYHVYGITPRGSGASSSPTIPPIPRQSITRTGPNTYELRPFADNPYDATRLGDDVIKVLDTLHIVRPVLVGHSIAGEELTAVASQYPRRVAGLIYLDAFAEFAFSDGHRYDALFTDQHPMRVTLPPGITPQRYLSKDNVYLLGMHEYRRFPAVPALVIFALPHEVLPGLAGPALAAYKAGQQRAVNRMHRIEPLLPTVHIVNLPTADHMVWESNRADVLQEINAFIGGLPRWH